MNKDNFTQMAENFMLEIFIAGLLAIVLSFSSAVNRNHADQTANLAVMFVLTLHTRLVVAKVVKEIYFSVDYLYMQLVFAVLTVVASLLATYYPYWGAILNAVLPIMIAYTNTIAVTQSQYKEWLCLLKRISIIDNKVIEYCKQE